MKRITFLPLFLLLVNTTFAQTINWQHTNGPEGIGDGTLWNDDEYAYYSDDFFLYRTSDGKNWEKINNISITKPSSYQNTMIAFSAGLNTIKIVMSSDSGETWEELINPSDKSLIFNSIVVCSHGIYLSVFDNVLYANKILRTIDKGKTWVALNTINPPKTDLYQIDNRVYFFGEKNLFRCDSTGLKWQKCSPSLYLSEKYKSVTGKYPLLALFTDVYARVWNQIDNTWSLSNISNLDLKNIVLFKNTMFATASSILYTSSDFGLTWESKTFLPNSYYEFAKLPETFLYKSSGNGIFRYESDSLVSANKGLTSGNSKSLVNNKRVLYSKNLTSCYRYFPHTKPTWEELTQVHLYPNDYDDVLTNDNSILIQYNEYNQQKFNISFDDGQTNQVVNLPIINGGLADKLFLLDSTVVFSSDLNTYTYSISNKSWKPAYSLNQLSDFYKINSLVKFKGKLYGVLQKYKSTNYATVSGYENGTKLDSFSIRPNFSPSEFFNTEDKLVCIGYMKGSNTKMMFVTSNGTDWDQSTITNNLYFHKIVGKGNNILAFGNIYSYLSIDGGINWRSVQMSPFTEFSLFNNELYAGGFGNGVFVTDFDAFFKVVSTKDDLTSAFGNDQIEIYPNPVTDVCMIELKDKLDKFLKIEVYTLNGNLIDSNEPAYSGDYFYLYTKQFRENILLVKITTEKGIYLHKVIKGH